MAEFYNSEPVCVAPGEKIDISLPEVLFKANITLDIYELPSAFRVEAFETKDKYNVIVTKT